MKPQPLSDAEFDRLEEILKRFGDKRAMNLEQLDGFFAALICGPNIVLPSEYLSEILGDQIINEHVFSAQPMLEEFFSLVTLHWNAMSYVLSSGDVFTPLLLEDKHGVSHANDWASGFMRGMELRREDWAPLVEDEDHGGSLVPIFALAHEHDPDPGMRPYNRPISAEQREKLIVGTAAGVMAIYHYFEAQRLMPGLSMGDSTTYRRGAPKVGRNDPCPCGSGKKFKHCCAKPTLH
ncbi:MAG: UPF0149 family protein [Xanthobacteraceae bacterium]